MLGGSVIKVQWIVFGICFSQPFCSRPLTAKLNFSTKQILMLTKLWNLSDGLNLLQNLLWKYHSLELFHILLWQFAHFALHLLFCGLFFASFPLLGLGKTFWWVSPSVVFDASDFSYDINWFQAPHFQGIALIVTVIQIVRVPNLKVLKPLLIFVFLLSLATAFLDNSWGMSFVYLVAMIRWVQFFSAVPSCMTSSGCLSPRGGFMRVWWLW